MAMSSIHTAEPRGLREVVDAGVVEGQILDVADDASVESCGTMILRSNHVSFASTFGYGEGNDCQQQAQL